ncbi:MAG: DinB family protein [Acidobacteriaceae bacterium]
MDSELQAVCDAYRARLAGRPVEWCRLHPQADDRAWSPQEVVEHLVLALRSSAGVLQTRIEKGRPSQASATLVQRLRRTFVFTFRKLPRGAPAPPFVRPGLLHWQPMDGTALAEQFRREMDATDKVLATVRERFGSRRAASHFLLGPLSAGEWRRFHAIHCRHHLAQLQRIERAIGPAAPGGHERSETHAASVL